MNRPFNKREIEDHLEKWGCVDYTISDDLVVDVQSAESLYIRGWFDKLPFSFGIVEGNFNCNGLGLTTLEGLPKIVKGDFRCSQNMLTDLKYCPEEVGGYFDCDSNKITSLKYCPKKVGTRFHANSNYIKNFDGFDCDFGGDFYVNANPIGSIIHYGCIDLVNWFKTYRVIKNDRVNFKRLRYVMGIFDKKIDIELIKKYYKIDE